MPKTEDQKQRERDAERDRAARRKRATDRLAALPQASRDAVRKDAQRRETAHKGARVTAVVFLEQALDAFTDPANSTPATGLRTTGAGRLTKAAKRPGTDTGDGPPAEDKPTRRKGPRERSTPKEAGRPAPETKDPEQLAANAKQARGGDAALKTTVAVTVPDGTAYCKGCDTTKAEAEFWPVTLTAKSKRRGVCRTCYNRQWKEWTADKKRKAAATT